MSTLNEIIHKWPRILILYPAYLQISPLIETTFPLVKHVRENALSYPYYYISSIEKSCLIRDETYQTYQIIEVLTELDGKHVEIMTVLFRKAPQSWIILRKEFIGHILVELPDSPLPEKLNSVMLSSQYILI